MQLDISRNFAFPFIDGGGSGGSGAESTGINFPFPAQGGQKLS
jgi:hypothetical protein